MPPRKRPVSELSGEEEEPVLVPSDSEDEGAWDEVDVTADNSASALARATAGLKPLDIVIGSSGAAKGAKQK